MDCKRKEKHLNTKRNQLAIAWHLNKKNFNLNVDICILQFYQKIKLITSMFIIKQKKVSDSIKIALKNVHGQFVTASQIRSNVQTLQNILFVEIRYFYFCNKYVVPHLIGNDFLSWSKMARIVSNY